MDTGLVHRAVCLLNLFTPLLSLVLCAYPRRVGQAELTWVNLTSSFTKPNSLAVYVCVHAVYRSDQSIFCCCFSVAMLPAKRHTARHTYPKIQQRVGYEQWAWPSPRDHAHWTALVWRHHSAENSALRCRSPIWGQRYILFRGCLHVKLKLKLK